MITLPDFKKAFEYENNFYLSCDTSRIGKIIAHYELYKKTLNISGAIVEMGVFKGNSFIRFAMFRSLFETADARKMIGFDVFGKFPEAGLPEDKLFREKFVSASGDESISLEGLMSVSAYKKVDRNIDLIKGDICQTVPEYVKNNAQLKIALLHVDTDNYEPSKVTLEYLYPRLVKGGVMILDDYGTYPGETKAVDEYFSGQKITIHKFPYSLTPSFVIKE